MQSLSTLQALPAAASSMQVPSRQRELLSQGAEVQDDPAASFYLPRFARVIQLRASLLIGSAYLSCLSFSRGFSVLVVEGADTLPADGICFYIQGRPEVARNVPVDDLIQSAAREISDLLMKETRTNGAIDLDNR